MKPILYTDHMIQDYTGKGYWKDVTYADLYQQLQPALTVFSGQGGVKPAVAPGVVLHAIPGLEAEEIDIYLSERAQNYISNEPPPPPLAIGKYGSSRAGAAILKLLVA